MNGFAMFLPWSLPALAAPPTPQTIWRAWNADPLLILGLLLAAALYARGLRALWRRAGPGRGVRRSHVAAFAAGLLVLALALLSPLDALSSALLAAHMVQHLLLMLVAAPLLVLGLPPVAAAWALPRSPQLARWWHRRPLLRRAWRALSHPVTAWLLYAGVLWAWHLPRLYEAALLNETVHALEHAAFLGAALLFWWALRHARALSSAGGALFLFTTALHSGLLGALLTFAAAPWYPVYSIAPYAWGLTPLQDQQLAGVIMWLPGSLVYLGAVLLLLGSWLYRQERQSPGDGRVVVPTTRPPAETSTG
ncbi:MAG TPA: cytochrome c oxidase assembly protein [Candidatus Sulfomarinibacteraceae bacterium]|nr:cytochrome c oxidase assembly protein [Candidatus Sulfomarinibacteraceae bacterium]